MEIGELTGISQKLSETFLTDRFGVYPFDL